MAYYGYEFYYDGTRATFFGYLCVALVNMGWTLHDDIDADTKVYKSNGESGNEPYGYLYIDAGTSTYIQLAAYQYWDNATHSGVRVRYPSDAVASGRLVVGYFTSTVPATIAGDKNTVIISHYSVATGSVSAIMVGHINRRADNIIINAHGTAGTAGTLTVATTTGLGYGKKVQIVGAEGCDNLSIVSLPDSSTVIVERLPRNYGTGAVIGAPASTFGINSGAVNNGYWYPCSVWGDSGTAGTSTAKYTISPILGPNIISVLFFNEKKYVLAPQMVYDLSTSGLPGGVIGAWDDYFLYGPQTADRDACIANNDGAVSTAGTASSGGTASLIDSTKAWTANALVGRFCVLTAGTGIGGIKKIASNNSTSFTTDSNWYTAPVSGTVYVIADLVRRGNSSWFNTNSQVLLTNTAPPS